MNDEKLVETQELFMDKLRELFPYKNGGKHKDFSKLDTLNLSDRDRKHLSMSVTSTFYQNRISPMRSLLLLEPLFTPKESALFQEGYIYQAAKAKAIRVERAKTISEYRKTFRGGAKSKTRKFDAGSMITTSDGQEVKVIKTSDGGNYIVEYKGERRLLGHDDMRLALKIRE